jgi:hypothetical protein
MLQDKPFLKSTRQQTKKIKQGELIMKKWIGMMTAVLLMCSTLAFAGGDNNQHRYDGSKGKGQIKQVRINK